MTQSTLTSNYLSKAEDLVLFSPTDVALYSYLMEEDGELVTLFHREPIQPLLDQGYVVMTESLASAKIRLHVKKYLTEWIEITEKRYIDLYSTFPPQNMNHGIFRFLEPLTDETCLFIAEYDNRYYTTERLFDSSHDDLFNELKVMNSHA